MYLLTPEECDQLVRYLNGEDDAFLDGEGPDKVFRISRDLARKMRSDIRAAMRERDGYRERLERFQEKKKVGVEERLRNRDFTYLGLDSADLGWAIVQACRDMGLPCSNKRMDLLLYECYTSWFGSKLEVLTKEGPAYTDFGPHFWRATKTVDVTRGVPEDALRRVWAANSGLRNFVSNVVKKYSTMGNNALLQTYTDSYPYRHAREVGGGKTNTPIDLVDIFRWRNPQKP